MINKEEIDQKFDAVTHYFDEPLASYTFTKTGGPADVLFFPKNKTEVQAIVSYCQTNQLSWTVLGNASNLIVRDGGMQDVVIMLTEMKEIRVEGQRIIVEAGARLIDTSYAAYEASLTGLEFACGIPGSVGGAVYMNAGAYEGDISQVFTEAEVLMPTGEVRTLGHEDLDFTYRHSALQVNQGIVLAATFDLQAGDERTIQIRMKELTFLRESKQPLEYPSCGSVFKRPEGHFTGKLIQEAGLQGKKWGGAQISEKHAGFIVNIDGATATDYIELIAHIQEVILAEYGVPLETEVKIIGREPNPA